MTIGVLDSAGLVSIFRQLRGTRLVGAHVVSGIVEIVFSDDGPAGNLVSIYCDAGRHTGLVAFGFVADPVDYCRDEDELEAAA